MITIVPDDTRPITDTEHLLIILSIILSSSDFLYHVIQHVRQSFPFSGVTIQQLKQHQQQQQPQLF